MHVAGQQRRIQVNFKFVKITCEMSSEATCINFPLTIGFFYFFEIVEISFEADNYRPEWDANLQNSDSSRMFQSFELSGSGFPVTRTAWYTMAWIP